MAEFNREYNPDTVKTLPLTEVSTEKPKSWSPLRIMDLLRKKSPKSTPDNAKIQVIDSSKGPLLTRRKFLGGLALGATALVAHRLVNTPALGHLMASSERKMPIDSPEVADLIDIEAIKQYLVANAGEYVNIDEFGLGYEAELIANFAGIFAQNDTTFAGISPNVVAETMIDDVIQQSKECGIHPTTAFAQLFIGLGNSYGFRKSGTIEDDILKYRKQLQISALSDISGVPDERMMHVLSDHDGILTPGLRLIDDRLPTDPWMVQRLFAPTTQGILDKEAEIFARGFQTLPVDLQKRLKETYPDAYESLSALLEARDKVEVRRTLLKHAADALVDGTYESMSQLFSPTDDQDASKKIYEQIGLGAQVSDWQKTNYTRFWASTATPNLYAQTDDVTEPDVKDILQEYIGLPAKFEAKGLSGEEAKKEAFRAIMYEQIHNPAFREVISKTVPEDARALYDSFLAAYASFGEEGNAFDTAEVKASGICAQYEYTYDFQMAAAIGMSKYFFEETQKAWHTGETNFDTSLSILASQIPTKKTLHESSLFARTIALDPPYDINASVGSLKHLFHEIQPSEPILPWRNRDECRDTLTRMEVAMYDTPSSDFTKIFGGRNPALGYMQLSMMYMPQIKSS